MRKRDEQAPVLREEVFYLLYPGLAQREENQPVARFCALCAARLGEERPVERVDSGLRCAQCLERMQRGPNRRKPGFLSGEDEEWYIYYRFCSQCGIEWLPKPLRWGVTSGSKAFCRACYQGWSAKETQWEQEAARSRMIFAQFWSDCQNGHLHTLPHGPRVYGLHLATKDVQIGAGMPSCTVSALILPPQTLLGMFYPAVDRPGGPVRLGWWSPFEQGHDERGQEGGGQ